MAIVGMKLRTLSFDLDNTLWDVDPVIEAAERRLRAWLEAECPRALEGYKPARLQALREEVALLYPGRDHDLTFLRKSVLERVLVSAGYAASQAQAAFEVFFAARNEVTLFADVLPALQRLAQRYRLVALTDGNADLGRVGLDHMFDHYINASIVGRAKPHAAMFEAVTAATGHSPRETLHIGDHPEKDVAGAWRSGFKTVWVNRQRVRWPLRDARPDVEVVDLTALADQLIS